MWILSVCSISLAIFGAIKSNPSSSKSINQDYRCPCLLAMKNDLPFSLLSFVANHELSLQEQHYNPWLSLENKACNGVSSLIFNSTIAFTILNRLNIEANIISNIVFKF
ncbi:hypothetical protein Patl1_34062 [Pistacia atlantica]|uniref:Uncharacterized protein n=1 Tax=Pistacia atlantica TaxID=434234 RepID=A0ACC0ZW50_9ROSI|nr:hypothetical protein Patl1_34062 [Pistacia atlantica]